MADPDRRAANLAWLLLLIIVGAAVTWFRVEHLAEAAALWGYEPSALTDPIWGRPEFASDFRNGEAETLSSLVGQAYRLLGFLPFSKRAIVAFMIFAEFSTLAVGAFVAVRAIDRTLPIWTALATALLLSTGSIVNADLGRWAYPFYGSTYLFAYGTGLLGFAAILRGKPIAGGLAIGVTGAIHPIIALFFGLAMAAAALVRISKQNFAHLAAGAALAALTAGVWNIAMLNPTGVSAGEIDIATYIELTRMMGYHWYPFTLGVFGQISYERLIPFIGFLVLFASLLGGGTAERNRVDRQVGAAVALLTVVALLGALISEYSNIPTLIKLALHRASLAALIISATMVVPRLMVAAISGFSVRAALSAALLLEAYFRNNGVPLGLCVLLAALVAYEERGQGVGRLALPVAAIATAAAAMILIMASGWTNSVITEPNIGLDIFFKPLFLAALGVALLARYLRQPALLAVAFALVALPWTPKVSTIRPNDLEQARAYLEVQEWAKANTAPDALFMTDPGHAYGWREHSERPSFGVVREWLLTGWGYRTDGRIFEEGMRRARSLGLDVESYFELDRAEPGNGKNIMSADATRLYHQHGIEWLGAMAAEYGIDYFVFDKQKMDDPSLLQTVFENGRYIVASSPENQ